MVSNAQIDPVAAKGEVFGIPLVMASCWLSLRAVRRVSVTDAFCAGALAVLHTNSLIDDETLRLSLPASGLSPAHLKCMWTRLMRQQEDPRISSKTASSKGVAYKVLPRRAA